MSTDTIHILGVDPGHRESHAVLIRAPLEVDAGARAELVETLPISMTDLERQARAHDAWALFHRKFGSNVTLAAVEYARGEVHTGRSGDGVLLNNYAAGLIAGALMAHHVPVIAVPPSGPLTAWAWRRELGAANTDRAVRVMVERYLDGELPTGARGGVITHWYDAAGIALAAWLRAVHTKWAPGQDAALLLEPTPLEAAVLERRAAYRATKRRARSRGGRRS